MTVGLLQLAETQLSWKTLRIGAGGAVRGMSVANDGTVVLRTDTYGGYVKPAGATSWNLLLSTNVLPSGYWNLFEANNAFYELVVAPSNSQIIYGMFNGYLFKSTNQGATFTQTALSQVSGPPASNDTTSSLGPYFAVDPVQPNTILVGTPSGGVQYSLDGGATWTQISTSTIPGGTTPSGANQGGGNLIAFDPSTTSGGSTPGIVITSYGNGVYRTTGGPSGSWTKLSASGMPTTFSHLIVDTGGRILIVDGVTAVGEGNLNICSSPYTSWSQTTQGDPGSWTTVAVDPTNTNHIVVVSPFGYLVYSTDNGSTWNYPSGSVTTTGDTPWLNITAYNNPDRETNAIYFDPSSVGRLLMVGGQFGFMYCTPTASTTTLTTTVLAKGIEQLVSSFVLAAPGASNVFLMSEDIPFWYKAAGTLNTNSTSYTPSYGSQFDLSIGYHADWAPGSPNTIAAIAGYVQIGSLVTGVSTDYGNTWTKFTPPGSNIGGNIACASATNWVYVPYSGLPYYTTNSGSSWTASTGITTNFDPGSPFQICTFLAADKVNTGTFYGYVVSAGVYKSTDGGATWSLVHSGSFDIHDGYAMVFKSSPTVAGDLWYSSGYQDDPGSPIAGLNLYRSTNSGTTWNPVTGFLSVSAVGFGAQVSGQSYPSIAAVGWYNSNYGVWQSLDNGVTWTQVGASYPLGIFADIPSIDGDKLVQGRWYIACNGIGFAYYG